MSHHGMDWMDEALCSDPTVDPAIFFPSTDTDTAVEIVNKVLAARKICFRCPVRLDCLEFCLSTGQNGIWGGTTDNERRTMSQKHRSTA